MANALAKPQGELEKTIARLEGKIISGANWVMKGEVKAGDRPVNSLLDYDL